MNVIILGSNVFDSMEYHLNDAFIHQGYQSQIIDFRTLFSNKKVSFWLKRISNKIDIFEHKVILQKILTIRPDLLIGVYKHIHPFLIEEVKKYLPNTICIQINQDQLTTLQNQQIFASPYDYYFSKDPFMVDFMKNKAGLNAYYLPEAFNPRIHTKPNIDKKQLEEKLDIDVLIWGTIYPYRAKFIEQLIKDGIKVKIFGKKGPFFPDTLTPYFTGKYLISDEKCKYIYGARIVLNNFHYAEVESVNLKYFEINGIGGFQICDYKDALKTLSPVSSELFSFTNYQKCIELIHKYLACPLQRYKIADKQHSFAMKNHTYQFLIEKIVEIAFNEKE